MENAELVRTVIFRPYRRNAGPSFRLQLFSGAFGWFATGQEKMGYRLTQYQYGRGCKPVVLFEGTDFGRSPGHTEDGNATVEGIMGFLTLRPGDTDADHFDGYTDEQRAFCQAHAEILACEVQARFCDENGNVRK